MPWPASSSRSASRGISPGPPALARAWPVRGKPLRSTAAPGSASRRSRTTDRTTGTRLRTRGPRLPGHTRCRRAGPALFAPANWTPIRGYGRYSFVFSRPHTRPRKGTEGPVAAGPSPFLLPKACRPPPSKPPTSSLREFLAKPVPWPGSREHTPAVSRERFRPCGSRREGPSILTVWHW